MKRKTNAFLLALYLFISGTLTGCKTNNNNEITEVTNITTSIIETTIKPTEPIIIETEPIIETIEETIPTPQLLSIDEIALEVISGKWGNGDERRNALINMGYNYDEVSSRVNEIINGAPYEIPDRNTYTLNFGYVTEKVDVYDENGNKEGSLSAYQKVYVTKQEVNNMTLVHFQNQTFYLKNKDIKLLADSHIEVDISDQKVYLYIEGELILEADIISGYPGKGTTPGTNLGITEIYSKSYNVSFSSSKKSEIFLLFNWDGEGLHDAPWRSDWEFDDKGRYLTHGSDGCLNMRTEDVEVLDEYAYLGMPVLIHK